MRDVKRIKIRLFKENYNFLLKIYNELFINYYSDFNSFFNFLIKNLFDTFKDNIYVVFKVEDGVLVEKHINFYQSKFFKFYFKEFKNKYYEYKNLKGGYVLKNIRLYDNVIDQYDEFGLMGYTEYNDFFYVNKNIMYTRLINFFIFLLKNNKEVFEYNELFEILGDGYDMFLSILFYKYFQENEIFW